MQPLQIRRPARFVALLATASLAVVSAADRAGASAPSVPPASPGPASSSPAPSSSPSAPSTEADVMPEAAAGLRQFFADLGEVVYQGDDIEVGDCPLVAADDVTDAFVGPDETVAFVAKGEAEVGWLGDEPAVGEVVDPVLLTCTFEVADDDSWPEIGIGAIDLTDESSAEWQEQFGTLPETDPQLAVGGLLRGSCDGNDCVVVWTGSEIAVLVYANYEEGSEPTIETVAAGAGPIITVALENLTALA